MKLIRILIDNDIKIHKLYHALYYNNTYFPIFLSKADFDMIIDYIEEDESKLNSSCIPTSDLPAAVTKENAKSVDFRQIVYMQENRQQDIEDIKQDLLRSAELFGKSIANYKM